MFLSSFCLFFFITNVLPLLLLTQAEQELRMTQSEFDRQAEITRLLLEGISSTHVRSPTAQTRTRVIHCLQPQHEATIIHHRNRQSFKCSLCPQAHHLRCLNDFVEAQTTYYAQCYQYMVDLQKQLGRWVKVHPAMIDSNEVWKPLIDYEWNRRNFTLDHQH